MKERLQPVPDLVLERLACEGVDTVFGITGGMMVVQLDAFTRTDKIKFVAVQHEQAAAMAAEAYARLHPSKLGVAMTTSGPGATNLITGMYGCWFDSIPSLFITGQVGTFDLKGDLGVRQKGFQEADMVATMKPFTKFSRQVTTPDSVVPTLNEAIRIAREGRPGPVHVDLPIDIQMSNGEVVHRPHSAERNGKVDVQEVVELISKAERPVLIAGAGIRSADAMKEFERLVDKLEWPVLPSWAFADCLSDDNPFKMGLFGIYGHRGCNFAIQNSDLVLAIGTRLDTRMTGSHNENFARGAKKIMVDIDPHELEKINPDVAVQADAKDFIQALLDAKIDKKNISAWHARCDDWKEKYPLVRKEYWKGKINPYAFSRTLSTLTPEGAVIIPDCGGNLTWMMQSWQFKDKQRLFSTYGNSPMGYSLPAAIGASFARPGEQIISVIGDGGIQMNIQELQTIKNHNLPIKIFVYSNDGYGIIRQFQDTIAGGRYFASREGCPDFAKVANAYGLDSMKITNTEDMGHQIQHALTSNRPMLIDVQMDPDANIEPKVGFTKPLEESGLSEEEINSNMLIPRWEKR